VVGVGFGGQRGSGPLHQGVGGVGVGGDVQEPELAEPALAVLVTARGHADHREPGGGQPPQGVTVQPAGARGDDGHLGLTGGGHSEQVAEVVAAVQDLCPDLSRLAGLHQRRFPGRPGPGRHHAHLHVVTAVCTEPAGVVGATPVVVAGAGSPGSSSAGPGSTGDGSAGLGSTGDGSTRSGSTGDG
jgi:hypothetical protein